MFTFREIVELIESELEYPTPWPIEKELEYRKMGLPYQTAAQTAVRQTKKSLIERLEQLKKNRNN